MLSFEPIGHVYRWDGAIVPSVTQVLEDTGIIDYSFIPDGTREMALERGRLIHEICAIDDEGELDEASVDELLMPYLLAWRKFIKETQFVANLIEHRVYNPTFGYAGTLDRSGTVILSGGNRADVMVDIKTNDAPAWTQYQLAAYCAGFDNPRAFRRLAVELHKDQSYKLYEFDGRDWQTDFGVFCAALTTYRVKRQCNPNIYRRQAA